MNQRMAVPILESTVSSVSELANYRLGDNEYTRGTVVAFSLQGRYLNFCFTSQRIRHSLSRRSASMTNASTECARFLCTTLNGSNSTQTNARSSYGSSRSSSHSTRPCTTIHSSARALLSPSAQALIRVSSMEIFGFSSDTNLPTSYSSNDMPIVLLS